jgi:peptidoglycan/xylan/chitin deacetylase (PgdA/CDA1 family)
LTSFAIVSPAAREILDAKCMIGKRWWNDGWWKEANDSNLMGIANHSWNHNHDALPTPAFADVRPGTFRTVDREEVAEFEIAQASAYLHRHAPGPSAALFAYPYGEWNDYLLREYFPQHARRIGVDAAFSDQPEPWTASSDRWCLPRYIFRRDWKSPDDLRAILRQAR